jgi:sugar phosphate permease
MAMSVTGAGYRNADTPFMRLLYRKIAWRLLPLLGLGYFVAYVDRVNVGFAKLTMLADLRMSEEAYAMGAGLFFLGYVLFETPSNLILHRVGARAWIARIMVSWGILSAATMLVAEPWQFHLLRFLTGVAEAGFLPGALYYLSCWFPAERRGRINSLFFLGLPIAGIVGSPLSGAILRGLDGVAHYAGWRWLFLLEGMPAVLIGLIIVMTLPDTPDRARWLSKNERQQLSMALAEDDSRAEASSFLDGLRNRRVWMLGMIDFGILLTTYALAFWLPTFIRAAGVEDPVRIGWYTAVPSLAALVCMLALGYNSDRVRERRRHLMIPFAVGIAAILAFPFATGNLIALLLVASILSGAVTGTVPVFFSLPATFLTGPAAAAGFAVACSVANIAGMVSNLLIAHTSAITGNGALAMLPFGLFLLAGILIVHRLPPTLVNR